MNVTYFFIIFWIMLCFIYAILGEKLEDMLYTQKGTLNWKRSEEIQKNTDFMIPFLKPLKHMIGIGGKSIRVTQPTTVGRRNAVVEDNETPSSAQRSKSQPVTKSKKGSDKSFTCRTGSTTQKVTSLKPTKKKKPTKKSCAKKLKNGALVEEFTTKLTGSANKDNLYENHNEIIGSDYVFQDREYPSGKSISTIVDSRQFFNNVSLSEANNKRNTTNISENYNIRSETTFSNVLDNSQILDLKKESRTESNGYNFIKDNNSQKWVDIPQSSGERRFFKNSPNKDSFLKDSYKKDMFFNDLSKHKMYQDEEKNISLNKHNLPLNSSAKIFPQCYIMAQENFPNTTKFNEAGSRHTPIRTSEKYEIISELNYKLEKNIGESPTQTMFQAWRLDKQDCFDRNRICLTERIPSRKWENIRPSGRITSPVETGLDKQEERILPCEGRGRSEESPVDSGRSRGVLERPEKRIESQAGNPGSMRRPEDRFDPYKQRAEERARAPLKEGKGIPTITFDHLGDKIDQLYQELQRSLGSMLTQTTTGHTVPDMDEDERIIRTSDALPQMTSSSIDIKNPIFFPTKISHKAETSKRRNMSYKTPYQLSEAQHLVTAYPLGTTSKENKFFFEVTDAISEQNKYYTSSELMRSWSFLMPLFPNPDDIHLIQKPKAISTDCNNIIILFPSEKRLIGKNNREKPTNEYLLERDGLIGDSAVTPGVGDFSVDSRYLFAIEPSQNEQTSQYVTKPTEIRPWLRKSDELYWKRKFRNGSYFANQFEESLRKNMKNNLFTPMTTLVAVKINLIENVPFATESYSESQCTQIDSNLPTEKYSITEWTENSEIYEELGLTRSSHDVGDSELNGIQSASEIKEEEYEVTENADDNISDDLKKHMSRPVDSMSDIHAIESNDNYDLTEPSLPDKSIKPYFLSYTDKLESTHDRSHQYDNLSSWKNLSFEVSYPSNGKYSDRNFFGSINHLDKDRKEEMINEGYMPSSLNSSDQLVNNFFEDSRLSITDIDNQQDEVASESKARICTDKECETVNPGEVEDKRERSGDQRAWNKEDTKQTDLKLYGDLQQFQKCIERTFLSPDTLNHSGVDGEITSVQLSLFKYLHKPQENEKSKDSLNNPSAMFDHQNKNYTNKYNYISSEGKNNERNLIFRKTNRKYDSGDVMKRQMDYDSKPLPDNKKVNRIKYSPQSNITLYKLEINSRNKKENMYNKNLNRFKLEAVGPKYPFSHVKILDQNNFRFQMPSKLTEEQVTTFRKPFKTNLGKIINTNRRRINAHESEIIMNKYYPFLSLNKNKFVNYLIST